MPSLVDAPIRVRWVLDDELTDANGRPYYSDPHGSAMNSYESEHFGRIIAIAHDTVLVVEDGTDRLIQERAELFKAVI